MANEEAIRAELQQRFGLTDDDVRIARERRVFATIPATRFREALEHACRTMHFTILCTITGQDEGENLTFLYHVARLDGTILSLKLAAPKSNPAIRTVTDLYPGGVSYERELEDLLGAKVEGLPPGKRYPLPDGWPEGQYPLRKDWSPEQLGDLSFPMKGA